MKKKPLYFLLNEGKMVVMQIQRFSPPDRIFFKGQVNRDGKIICDYPKSKTGCDKKYVFDLLSLAHDTADKFNEMTKERNELLEYHLRNHGDKAHFWENKK